MKRPRCPLPPCAQGNPAPAAAAAAQARGERIAVDDFGPGDSLPDDQNAAVLLQVAGRGVKQTPGQEEWSDNFAGSLPLSANDLTMMRGVVAANATSLMQARQARSRPRADYGVRMRSPVYSVTLPYLN